MSLSSLASLNTFFYPFSSPHLPQKCEMFFDDSNFLKKKFCSQFLYIHTDLLAKFFSFILFHLKNLYNGTFAMPFRSKNFFIIVIISILIFASYFPNDNETDNYQLLSE
ncbi:hypothetical protein ACKWTF_008383 [Chironomus riparius]